MLLPYSNDANLARREAVIESAKLRQPDLNVNRLKRATKSGQMGEELQDETIAIVTMTTATRRGPTAHRSAWVESGNMTQSQLCNS
jgi:hypothetical protein